MNAIGTTMLCVAAEAVFTFPPYAGNIRLSQAASALTPFGGLAPWAAFHKGRADRTAARHLSGDAHQPRGRTGV